jgi:hypothetical protein
MRTFTPIVKNGKENICYPEISINKIEKFANRMTKKNQKFYFKTTANGVTETLTFEQIKTVLL